MVYSDVAAEHDEEYNRWYNEPLYPLAKSWNDLVVEQSHNLVDGTGCQSAQRLLPVQVDAHLVALAHNAAGDPVILLSRLLSS